MSPTEFAAREVCIAPFGGRNGTKSMYFHTQFLINEIAQDDLDPAAANALQEGLGGQFGQMRTMMQYLNFQGTAAKPYRDQPTGES